MAYSDPKTTEKREREDFTTVSRRKNKKFKPAEPEQYDNIASDPKLAKYWNQRYHLFSKFDEGIKLDRESWYSVTSENIAAHIAKRCQCDSTDIVVDAFCGVGSNTIQFALTCSKVIAIDIDRKRLEMTRHNAQIYKVADRIELIQGDFLQLAPKLKADVVFLSPPWGGPEYIKQEVYNLDNMAGFKASEIMEVARTITSEIAFLLPRNCDEKEVKKLAGVDGTVSIESNKLDEKVKTITAYFGGISQI